MPQPLRIATRKSPLAIWQAEEVQRRLAATGVESVLIRMSTRGDEILDTPLAKIGGKGLFVKELQRGMLEGRADLAVHSMKDLGAEFPDGLHLASILARENPHDALVSNQYRSLDELPAGARVGTCSLRRQCQLMEKYPHLQMLDLRGNVNTRLAKLDNGDFDAIILAAAGLIRLGLDNRITTELPTNTMLPACAQGAIGIECKSNDENTNAKVRVLHDADTAARVSAERSLNARLGGSCQTPIAAFCELDGATMAMRALVGTADGKTVYRANGSGHRDQAEELGTRLAEELLSMGAQTIIASLSQNDSRVT